MKVREILGAFVFAILGTWVIQSLFFSKITQQNEAIHSGTSFTAPLVREAEPLNTEIDFVDMDVTSIDQTIEIETEGAYLRFNSSGAVLDRLIFKRRDQDDLVMVLPNAKTNCEHASFLVALQDKTPYEYVLVNHIENNDSHHLIYEVPFFAGTIKKEFIVYKNRYQIDLVLVFVLNSEQDVQARIMFPSPQLLNESQKNIIAAIFNTPKGLIAKIAQASLNMQQGWISPTLFGTEGKYFIQALVADQNNFVRRAYFKSCGPNALTSILEGPTINTSYSWTVSFYFGPKQLQEVKLVDERLEETFDYSGLLAPLSRILLAILSYLYLYCHNYGLAIIGLTILVKLILLPFTLSSGGQIEATRKRKEYDKKMRHLKQKYKDDPNELYRERKELLARFSSSSIPQVGGCLFALIQMVVVIALSRALASSFELYNASFLWIPDLALPDPYYIIPIVLGISLIQSRMSVSSESIVSTIPLGIIFAVCVSYMASGMGLYIVTAAVLSIVQGSIVKAFKRG